MKSIALIISCEHAVNTIPDAYTHLFKTHLPVLQTHRAIDFGAEALATHLANAIDCTYVKATASRLLIDCNRSLTHPHCFSEWTIDLTPSEKNNLITTYYHPFRQPIIQSIEQHIQAGKQVIHLSIHSFTPTLNGIKRETDIGLLYDPKHTTEKNFAHHFKKTLATQAPTYRVRMNYPYKGTSNGLTQQLRKNYDEHNYIGLEIESNQALFLHQISEQALIQAITQTLRAILTAEPPNPHLAL